MFKEMNNIFGVGYVSDYVDLDLDVHTGNLVEGSLHEVNYRSSWILY